VVQTAKLLTLARDYVYEGAKQGKQFIFIGTKSTATEIISEEAIRCGAHFVNDRWLGGTLTNWLTVKNRVGYLNELNKKEEMGELQALPKKEAAVLRRRRYNLSRNLGGLTKMEQVPEIAIVVDPRWEATAVAECNRLGITVISLLDTNSNPDLVNMLIPGNADHQFSIKLIISTLSQAIAEGLSGR
jgi:small subunit ribosomal protein S2